MVEAVGRVAAVAVVGSAPLIYEEDLCEDDGCEDAEEDDDDEEAEVGAVPGQRLAAAPPHPHHICNIESYERNINRIHGITLDLEFSDC